VFHTLTDLNLDDEGNYSCIAESRPGAGMASMFLDVTDPPPFIHPTANITVAPGDWAMLDCVVETKVAYEVKWYKVSPYSGEYCG